MFVTKHPYWRKLICTGDLPVKLSLKPLAVRSHPQRLQQSPFASVACSQLSSPPRDSFGYHLSFLARLGPHFWLSAHVVLSHPGLSAVYGLWMYLALAPPLAYR